jgi:hypothetical protein
MSALVWGAGGVAAGLALAVGAGLALRRADLRDDRRTMATLRAQAAAAPAGVFDPVQQDGLPEPARRYLLRAIRPGTPLARCVTLEMQGSFLLNGKPLPMTAHQVLAPPAGFVWQARIGRGPGGFAGSDGLAEGRSWTRFRLGGLVPLVRAGGNADHLRSARTRAMMESIWCPAVLLPGAGAVWRQIGPDAAEVHFPTLPDIPPMRMTLDAEGHVREIVAMRWSDANADRRYRLQPFGGRVLESRRFGGFTLPARVELGNLWGTPDVAPFFRAEVLSARF